MAQISNRQQLDIINNRQIQGCTDPAANNYNSSATFDDGSCVYGDTNLGGLDTTNLTDFIGPREEVQNTNTPTFNPDTSQAICMFDTKYGEDWVNTGYAIYIKENSSNEYWRNANGFGDSPRIDVAISLLRDVRPDATPYYNSIDKTPWIVPHYYLVGDTYTLNNSNRLKLREVCDAVGGEFYEYIDGDSVTLNQERSFSACLCNTTPVLGSCETLDLEGNIQKVNKQNSTCVKNLKDYYNFCILNYSLLGIKKFSEKTTFFNEFVLQQIGLTPEEANFVINNITVSENKEEAFILMDSAFNNGGNLYLQLGVSNSMDIVRDKECCVTNLGGIYREGKWVDENGKTHTGSTCLCEEPKVVLDETQEIIKCPNFIDNFIELGLDSDTGETIITNITEECCSNQSLQSRLDGNWTWDGTKCVLKVENTSTIIEDTTKIVVNETPIVSDVCDEVEISLYVYFTQPSNGCLNGELITNSNGYSSNEIPQVSDIPQINTVVDTSLYAQQTFIPDYQGPDVTNINTNTSSKCCYDSNTPIVGRLFIEGNNQDSTVEYIESFISTDNFNKWIKLTTRVSGLDATPFNIGVEFTQGLFKCCSYDIYFDDISVTCQTTRLEQIYLDTKSPGFKLDRVIDNKKSWVYNPGDELISDGTYDIVTRENGTTGLIQGHGNINRTFAPSPDADLDFRDTDYYNFSNVVEKHSDLVLNSKEVVLQFNMCADSDCVITSGSTFPNLIELERFKKTFQGFWTQFMEQFIPSTTIFVSGEKWCNSTICEEKVTNDYLLESSLTEGGISPAKISQNIIESGGEVRTDIKTTPETTNTQIGEKGDTTNVAVTDTTFGETGVGTKIVGDTKLQYLERDLYETKRVRQLPQSAY